MKHPYRHSQRTPVPGEVTNSKNSLGPGAGTGAYIQDTWKANANLTVNYGVRFEPFIAPYDGQGRTNYFSYEAFAAGFRSAT